MIKINEEEKIAKREHEEILREIAQSYSEEQFIEELRSQRETSPLSLETEEFIQWSKIREKSEEQEKEAPIPRSPHSNETESCIEGEFTEPPIQEAHDKEDAPTIQQYPSLEIKDMKAVETSTKRRIVTEKQRIISMKKRRSKDNPTLDPTSKFIQANHKRKLAGKRHSKQGGINWLLFSLEVISLNKLEEEKEIHEQNVKLMTVKERLLGGNPTRGSFLFLVNSIKELNRFSVLQGAKFGVAHQNNSKGECVMLRLVFHHCFHLKTHRNPSMTSH
ncbi:hypothetical protein AHAS_Ahas20G0218400 [Arachis hypogaea]